MFDHAAAATAALPALPAAASNYPRMLLLRRPDGFRHASDSASDNAYMQATDFDAERAVAQWQGLVDALRAAGHLVLALPGDPTTPEAVFPNNVFATAPGRLVIGAMRHPSRQREARDANVRQRLVGELGLRVIDLSTGDWVAELTGSLVIDRGRSLGYCGLSERCDRAGAEAMQRAFDLRTMLCFDLAEGEYHTNVVLSALGSRGLLLHPKGFADPDWVSLWRRWHGPALVEVDAAEKAAFAANCIALADDQLWLSATAAAALRESTRTQLQSLGWQLHSVPLDEIERAGGSLRCMVGEIY
ncbi:MAG: amidinotransferase [Xanthomonadales bacterium]|nr:amidinotransferase [Xanthomonadales bacterium]